MAFRFTSADFDAGKKKIMEMQSFWLAVARLWETKRTRYRSGLKAAVPGERTRPRVLAMTPSASRTFSLGTRLPGKVRFGEAPEPAREGAWAPRKVRALRVGGLLPKSVFGDLAVQVRLERLLEVGFGAGLVAASIFGQAAPCIVIGARGANSMALFKSSIAPSGLPARRPWHWPVGVSAARDEIAEEIIQHGGRVSGSAGKKTSYVFAGEEAGSKLEKARKLGIRIVDEGAFRRMF